MLEARLINFGKISHNKIASVAFSKYTKTNSFPAYPLATYLCSCDNFLVYFVEWVFFSVWIKCFLDSFEILWMSNYPDLKLTQRMKVMHCSRMMRLQPTKLQSYLLYCNKAWAHGFLQNASVAMALVETQEKQIIVTRFLQAGICNSKRSTHNRTHILPVIGHVLTQQ